MASQRWNSNRRLHTLGKGKLKCPRVRRDHMYPQTSTLPENTVNNHPPISTNHLIPFRLPWRAGRSHLKITASVTRSKCHLPGQGAPKTPLKTHDTATGASLWPWTCRRGTAPSFQQQNSDSWSRHRRERSVTLDPGPRDLHVVGTSRTVDPPGEARKPPPYLSHLHLMQWCCLSDHR